MAMLRSRGGRGVTTRPSISTSPVDGVSSPAIILSSVVLPQPDGPSSTRNSPSRTGRSMPSTAATPSKRLRSSRVSTVAMAARRLDEALAAPLLDNPLALGLCLLDGVFGRIGAARGLRKHRVEHPGVEDLV